MPDPKDKSVMRSLGEFFGHLVRAIRTDPARREVRRKVEEHTRDTPTGRVTLRRTTIEEIEVHPDESQKPGGSPPAGGQE